MSRNLQETVAVKIQEFLPGVERIPGTRSMWRRGSNKLNVRTRGSGSGGKFWFDVTPGFYERREVDFFLFACGDAQHIYVIPRRELQVAASKASLGGDKQVPQLDFYVRSHELMPAGSGQRIDIKQYYNAFSIIPELSSKRTV